MTMAANELVEVLRAAGEPTRLRVLALLAHEELAVAELVQIVDQSQPRVSRHLKLLAEAGLVERFPDGAWVFYRLGSEPTRRGLVGRLVGLIPDTDTLVRRDLERLDAVRRERADAAAAYFAQNAERWAETRSLYVAEEAVEAAILDAAGPGPYARLIDLGTGAGRMLTLLGARAQACIGLDLSQQMLNIARAAVQAEELGGVELRHGDIFDTRLAGGAGEVVVLHRVLHYLNDPAAALAEAVRLTAPGGRLLIADFAPHSLEFLRQSHQHRRLGFSDDEIERWLGAAGASVTATATLPPPEAGGLTVKVWTATRKGVTA